MSKARRRRKLVKLQRFAHRREWLADAPRAYREAWRRCWYDLNVQSWRRALAPWRVPTRRVWLLKRPARLPSVHGKIR